MVTDRPRERAQLILIGAITLAVIVVSLTVLVNSLFVTETSGTRDVTAGIDDAGEFERNSREATMSLVLRTNHRHRNATATELADIIERNVTAYGQLVAESRVASSGSYVALTYHNDSSLFGSRVVQAADGAITSYPTSAPDPAAGQRSDWVVGDTATQRDIGWFTMNLDVDSTSESPLRITATNATGEWVSFDINQTTAGSGVNLAVRSNVSHAGNTTAVCDPSRDRVLLDLVSGSAFSSDCEFNGTAAVEPPYTVEVENGDNAVGKYELVYNDSTGSSAYGECGPGLPTDQPCASPAVWQVNVTATFAADSVEYRTEYNASVYGGQP
jgi:hypothetical protein